MVRKHCQSSGNAPAIFVPTLNPEEPNKKSHGASMTHRGTVSSFCNISSGETKEDTEPAHP